jgi:hypothetical protein
VNISDSKQYWSNEEEWVGVYYPTEGIDDPRSRTLLCLLFDRVICYFPVTGMDCGGSSGMIDFFSDDPLVEAGILELREEVMVPEIEPKSKPEDYWGTGEDLDRFVELQVTSMALNACANFGAVPVTDRMDWPVPAALTNRIDVPRFAKLQAASLAIQSLNTVIPLSTDITGEETLEARTRLKEQLLPFRRAMLSLAPLVRQGVNGDSSMDQVHKEAKYIAETHIAPTIHNLQDRLSKESGRFWRRLILRSGMLVPSLIFNWVTKDAISAVISSLETAREAALDMIDRKALLSSLKTQGGLGYLLSVGSALTSTVKSAKRQADR